MDNIELRCEKCSAFLRVRPKATFISVVLCSNSKCKHENNIKIVTSDSSEEELRYIFTSKN